MIQRLFSKFWAMLAAILGGKPSLEFLSVGTFLIIDNTECEVQGVWNFTDSEGYGWKEYVLTQRRVGELNRMVSLEVERDDGQLHVKFWEQKLPLGQLPFEAANPKKWPVHFDLGIMSFDQVETGQMVGTIPGETPYSAQYADYKSYDEDLFSIETSRGGEVEAWIGRQLDPDSIKIDK